MAKRAGPVLDSCGDSGCPGPGAQGCRPAAVLCAVLVILQEEAAQKRPSSVCFTSRAEGPIACLSPESWPPGQSLSLALWARRGLSLAGFYRPR